MTWADDVHGWLLARLDHAVEVRVNEVEAWGGAPVAHQAGLHVIARKGFTQQWVIEQVDLSNAHVVGGAPPQVDS